MDNLGDRYVAVSYIEDSINVMINALEGDDFEPSLILRIKFDGFHELYQDDLDYISGPFEV